MPLTIPDLPTEQYLESNPVTTTFTFVDETGAYYDPSSVKVDVRTPAGVVTTYTYNTDAQPTRTSTGIYKFRQVVTPGDWVRKCYSPTTGQEATNQHLFYVKAAKV